MIVSWKADSGHDLLKFKNWLSRYSLSCGFLLFTVLDCNLGLLVSSNPCFGNTFHFSSRFSLASYWTDTENIQYMKNIICRVDFVRQQILIANCTHNHNCSPTVLSLQLNGLRYKVSLSNFASQNSLTRVLHNLLSEAWGFCLFLNKGEILTLLRCVHSRWQLTSVTCSLIL